MSAEPPEVPPPPPVLPPERPLAAPNPLRTLAWTVLRILLVQVPLSVLVVAFLWLAFRSFGSVADGRAGLFVTLLLWVFAAFLCAGLDWHCAGKTWRVYRGWEPTPSFAPLANIAAGLGVVALAACFMVPVYGDLWRKTEESETRGALGRIRSALSAYSREKGGAFAGDLRVLTQAGKYLRAIPPAKVPPHHSASAEVHGGPEPSDSGGWWYRNTLAAASDYGTVRVNCTHTDVKGSLWTAY